MLILYKLELQSTYSCGDWVSGDSDWSSGDGDRRSGDSNRSSSDSLVDWRAGGPCGSTGGRCREGRNLASLEELERTGSSELRKGCNGSDGESGVHDVIGIGMR
jgi:hypothetical protein